MTAPIISLEGVSQALRQAARSRRARRQPVRRRPCARPSCMRSTASILAIAEGEVVGLVGESGCGKSTLGRIVAGILPAERRPGAASAAVPLEALGADARRAAALGVQMIFQDPMASLNPRMRVAEIIGEAPLVHGIVSAGEAEAYVDAMLATRRPRSGLPAALPAPVLRRPARAHRHRARARRQAAVPGVRRVGRGARRLDPGAGAQPVHAAAPRPQAHLPVHQPRPRRGRAPLRPRRDHVSGPRGRDRADRGAVRRRRTIPTRRRCSPTCRGSMRASSASRRSRARSPPRSIRRRGCHFHPRCPFAFARCRSERPALKEIAPGRLSACHLNDGM